MWKDNKKVSHCQLSLLARFQTWTGKLSIYLLDWRLQSWPLQGAPWTETLAVCLHQRSQKKNCKDFFRHLSKLSFR